jgi:hypothetical protein
LGSGAGGNVRPVAEKFSSGLPDKFEDEYSVVPAAIDMMKFLDGVKKQALPMLLLTKINNFSLADLKAITGDFAGALV